MGPDQRRQSSHENATPGSFAAPEQSTTTFLDEEREVNLGGLCCKICGQEGAVAPSDWPES
jgi:hypothetical protein